MNIREEQINYFFQLLEGINESLNILATEIKANKELKIHVNSKLSQIENSLHDLKDDPFGLNKGN